MENSENTGTPTQTTTPTQGNAGKGRHRLIIVMRYLVAVVAVAVAALLFFAGRYWTDNKSENFTKSYTLYVYPDMTAAQALDSLIVNGQVKRQGSLQRAAAKEDLATRITPGKYRIDSACTSIYAVRMIANGWQAPHNLTLSGTIRSKGRLAGTIGRQMMTDSLTVDSLLNDSAFLATLGFTPENVFALFLPDTYEMWWTTPAEEIFQRFKKEYDLFWTQERLDKAAAQGLTKEQVSILASIVSGETLKTSEYPIIARVYLNRLHTGMLLQADPTIAYCFDYKISRILKVHTQVDSPFNTYKYKGLPPAPINVPPKACLDAVLNPDDNSYIYFCASPDFNGGHRFATSYSEHLRNAREFHTALT
ncbi:MAG: endolytic transglycosylase MltG, partial [Bacteroidales bacterium]|nr:endolytic transglycosylase MltG [Bacteroidales bacterium]